MSLHSQYDYKFHFLIVVSTISEPLNQDVLHHFQKILSFTQILTHIRSGGDQDAHDQAGEASTNTEDECVAAMERETQRSPN